MILSYIFTPAATLSAICRLTTRQSHLPPRAELLVMSM